MVIEPLKPESVDCVAWDFAVKADDAVEAIETTRRCLHLDRSPNEGIEIFDCREVVKVVPDVGAPVSSRRFGVMDAGVVLGLKLS